MAKKYIKISTIKESEEKRWTLAEIKELSQKVLGNRYEDFNKIPYVYKEKLEKLAEQIFNENSDEGAKETNPLSESFITKSFSDLIEKWKLDEKKIHKKYIKLITEEAGGDMLDSINSFFVALYTKPESINNLSKVIAEKLLNSATLELQDHVISKPLEGNELVMAKDSYDYPYSIKLRYKYKKDIPLGNFIESVEINLTAPNVVTGKKNEHAIYFVGNPIVLNMNNSEKTEIGVSYAVYYITSAKTFDVIVS